MPDRPFMIRILFAGGMLLAIFSLIFWFTLPVSSTFPPFLVTALLMLGYGAACRWGSRLPSRRKP